MAPLATAPVSTSTSTRIVESLDDISPVDLARLSAVAEAYCSPEWWRVFEDVPVAEITGGEADLRFVVVEEGGEVVAVQPLMHVRNAEEVFAYNLRRHYFEHFFEPTDDRPVDAKSARLFKIAKGYGRFLRGIGVRMDEVLVAASPVAYSGLATVDDDPGRRARCWDAVANVLKDESRRLRCPVLVPFVESGIAPLTEAGFREVFEFYDNRIPLDGFATFDDYLATFSKSSRQNKRREMRRTLEAGITFRTVDDVEPHAERVTELYDETSRRHANRYPRFPAAYWTSLKRSFGDQLQFLLAFRGEDEVVGFHTLLECPASGDLCSSRTGRSYAGGLGEVPFYFEMCIYEPIRRALAGGFRGLRLGPGSEQGKVRRRARQHPLHGYVWMPGGVRRFLMGRYMLRFGAMLRSAIAKQCDVPLDVVEGE